VLQKVSGWSIGAWVLKVVLLLVPLPLLVLTIGFHSNALSAMELMIAGCSVLGWLFLGVAPLSLFFGQSGIVVSVLLMLYHGWQALSATELAQTDFEQAVFALLALLFILVRVRSTRSQS
jgi:hypothetical protein